MSGETQEATTEETVAEETQEQVSEEQLSEEEISAAESELSQKEMDMIDELVLKVDGEEVVKKLPFKVSKEHIEYIRKQEQLAAVAQKRMQESAMYKKQNDDVQNELKELVARLKGEDGEELLQELFGVDVEAMAKRVLQKKLAEAEKTPEQKAAEQAERERQKRITELEAKLKQKEEVERKMQDDAQAKEIEEGIIGAIESQGLPTDARVISRFAQAMRAGIKYGVDIKPEEVAPIIKNQLYEEAKFYAGTLKDEELEDMLGKDRITSLRKNFISRIRKNVPSKNQIKETSEPQPKPFAKKERGSVKPKDFFKNLEQKFSK